MYMSTVQFDEGIDDLSRQLQNRRAMNTTSVQGLSSWLIRRNIAKTEERAEKILLYTAITFFVSSIIFWYTSTHNIFPVPGNSSLKPVSLQEEVTRHINRQNR